MILEFGTVIFLPPVCVNDNKLTGSVVVLISVWFDLIRFPIPNKPTPLSTVIILSFLDPECSANDPLRQAMARNNLLKVGRI